MKKPSKEELRVLDTFFRTTASHLGVFDRSSKQSNQSHPLFQSNLDILRTLIKKKVDLKLLEDACRRALSEGVKSTKINEVAPELEDEAQLESLDRNLIKDNTSYLHRKLRKQISVVSVGFIEIDPPDPIPIELFTMKDLISFYMKSTNQTYTSVKAKSLIGPFNYLLLNYSLDQILFAIDYIEFSGMRISNPLDLAKLINDATDEIEERKGRQY